MWISCTIGIPTKDDELQFDAMSAEVYLHRYHWGSVHTTTSAFDMMRQTTCLCLRMIDGAVSGGTFSKSLGLNRSIILPEHCPVFQMEVSTIQAELEIIWD